MRRSRKVIFRRERREVQIQACMTGVLSLLVVAALIFLSEGALMTTKESVYGAFLLANESGGYVLVALIYFILGIMVTLFSIKYKKLRSLEEMDEKGENDN